MNMSQSHVLVVVVDGLRASALGAYGNTNYRTPALDRFSAASLLFDSCFAAAARLDDIYRAMWNGLRPLHVQNTADAAISLSQLARQCGYEAILISDDEAVLALPGGEHFGRRIGVPIAAPDRALLPSLYHAFGIAAEVIEQANASDQHHFVWLHSRGMYGRWDAPVELQAALIDEGDPPPIVDSDSPVLDLGPADSDTAFQYACAYAAQVMVLDECWQGLCEILECGRGSDWLVVLIGARGFPLGEHGKIGGVDERLYVEQLHVPFLMQFPNGLGRLARRLELVSHVDLGLTLANCIAATTSQMDKPLDASDGRNLLPLAADLSVEWRDILMGQSEHARSLRTAEWSCRSDFGMAGGAVSGQGAELFVRPDDRWEANDVAVRCPEEVAEMERRAEEMLRGSST
jgi:arylsulfatase A-like enzyme